MYLYNSHTMILVLSLPPASRAAFKRLIAILLAECEFPRMCDISSSATISFNPSLHRRYISPSLPFSQLTAGITPSLGPIALVTRFFPGSSPAQPLITHSLWAEWSSVN